MSRHCSLLVLASAAAALAFSSCIDGREEIWIARDGSGRAEATYVVPAAALLSAGGSEPVRAQVESWLKSQPGITVEAVTIAEADGRAKVRTALNFKSGHDLLDLVAPANLKELPAAVRGLVGTVDFRQLGRSFTLRRSVRLDGALAGALWVSPRADLANHQLEYVVHLPMAAAAQNATVVSDGGRTLTWRHSLATVLESPPVIELGGAMPWPWWVWAIGGGVLLPAVLIGYRFVRRSVRGR